jgi:hypothetical protein
VGILKLIKCMLDAKTQVKNMWYCCMDKEEKRIGFNFDAKKAHLRVV